MGMVNKERCADCGQSPVGGVEEGIGGLVVLRTYPLALEHAPQCLGDVEVRRVRRKEEEEKTPALPDRSQLLYEFASVDAGIVKHNDGVPFPRPEGHPVEEVRQLLEVKPSYRLSLVVIPKMLRWAIFWDGMWTSSPWNCHP